MIRISICDMHEDIRSRIQGFCEMFFKDKYIEYNVREYASGESLLKEDFPDVLFLSMEMKRIQALLIRDILYKMNQNTKIVFISHSVEHMQESFGKNVYGFLLNPIRYIEFESVLRRMVGDTVDEQEMIFCKHKHKIEKIFMKEITYIKADGRYTQIFIHGKKEYRLSDCSFGEWYVEMESKSFLRCHRSYLVNLFYIKSVGKDIELLDESKLPIGGKMRKEFHQEYEAYMRKIRKSILK